jgi:hypothetical protein
MGEVSKYFVPEDASNLVGKEHEIAEAFWNIGIFVVTRHRFIYQRIDDWNEEGRALPASGHDFPFAEMGLGASPLYEPVPNSIYDLACPKCDTDLTDEAHEVWEDEDSRIALPLRKVVCPNCRAASKSANLKSQHPFTFSRSYLWVADIESDEWDGSFKETVASVPGRCREITAWET